MPRSMSTLRAWAYRSGVNGGASTPGWGGTGPLVRARGVIRYFRRDPGVDVHVWNGDASGNDLEVRWV